jgi:hypothetical protein
MLPARNFDHLNQAEEQVLCDPCFAEAIGTAVGGTSTLRHKVSALFLNQRFRVLRSHLTIPAVKARVELLSRAEQIQFIQKSMVAAWRQSIGDQSIYRGTVDNY